MASQEDISQWRNLLAIHRRNAKLLRKQLAMHTVGYVLPGQVSGMEHELKNITELKERLGNALADVEDDDVDSFDLQAYLGDAQ